MLRPAGDASSGSLRVPLARPCGICVAATTVSSARGSGVRWLIDNGIPIYGTAKNVDVHLTSQFVPCLAPLTAQKATERLRTVSRTSAAATKFALARSDANSALAVMADWARASNKAHPHSPRCHCCRVNIRANVQSVAWLTRCTNSSSRDFSLFPAQN
jgi:hypothetical protein